MHEGRKHTRGVVCAAAYLSDRALKVALLASRRDRTRALALPRRIPSEGKEILRWSVCDKERERMCVCDCVTVCDCV